MKKYLMLICLIGVFKCSGQGTCDTIITENTIGGIMKDTIPLIMLIADTSNKYGIKKQEQFVKIGDKLISMPQYFDFVIDSTQRNFNHNTFWVNGHSVRSIEYRFVDISVDPNYDLPSGGRTLMGWVSEYETQPFYTHVKYLDSNKKPLPESIVVWMTKPLNNQK